MALFLGDIRIKTMVELGLEDISKNPWILDDILGDTLGNPYLKERYGSQIESCRQWLANNRVYTFLSARDDKMEFPCVVIELGNSNEKPEMKHMGDLSVEKVKLIPNEINKPIPFVIKPMAGSYDPTSGIFTFGSDINTVLIAPGMILVNPTTGVGYIIQSVSGENQIALEKNLEIPATTFGVIPKYQYYESKIGHTFMSEPYKITCNALDQQTLLWLHSITIYSLLRYRQVLLEKDGFAESVISSGPMYPNGDYSDAGQVIWSRDINLIGQVENRWVMQPHRIIENFSLGNGGGSSETDSTYIGGIKIISNITDAFEDLGTVNWSTIADIAHAGDNE